MEDQSINNNDILDEEDGVLDSYFNTEPSDSQLFHYCNQDGLMGIVKDKKVWASNILYLNDSQEFEYACTLALNILSRKSKIPNPLENYPDIPSIARGSLLEMLHNAYKNFTDFQKFHYDFLTSMIKGLHESAQKSPIFVFSLSEEKDLLSQWRGYCPRDGGFSLGFDLKQLLPRLEKNKFRIAKCIYNEIEQEELVEKLLKKPLEFIEIHDLADPANLSEYVKALNYFIRKFNEIAPVLKHKSFKEEEEWRIISPRTEKIYNDIEYRKGKSIFVPYIKIPIVDDNEKIPLSTIYVGPK